MTCRNKGHSAQMLNGLNLLVIAEEGVRNCIAPRASKWHSSWQRNGLLDAHDLCNLKSALGSAFDRIHATALLSGSIPVIERLTMRVLTCCTVLITILAVNAIRSGAAETKEVFFEVALSDLQITSGQLPKSKADEPWRRGGSRLTVMQPRVLLAGGGEAYLRMTNDEIWRLRFGGSPDWSTEHIVVRAAAGDVKGQIILPNSDAEGMQRVDFSIPAAAAKDAARWPFYEAKMMHYQLLALEPIPGTAWFRHEAAQAEQELRAIDPKREISNAAVRNWATPGVTDAYDLFSGGRAVSENLQFDRMLGESPQATQPTVDVNTLEGITIAAIDWKPLLKDANPKLDPLSQFIPADQQVVFFSSFDSAIKLSDQARASDALVTRFAEPRSEDADVIGRYERQLGIGLSAAGRLIGPAAITRIALTGSDPYYRSGTDVAVLFETEHADVLAKLLNAQILASTAKASRVQRQSGLADGVKYQVFRSPERTVSSYVAQLNGQVVVVTNSLVQLERLAKVGKSIDPISSLDEYKFFRARYPLNDESESALLFLSDATIRRWCSARWRIASARRTFAAGALAELTANNAKALVTGTANDAVLHSDLPLVNGGELKLRSTGVSSSTQGTLAWLTPIIEMPIDKVTKAEADAYTAWRNGYQSNWRWAFDPIAFRIGVLDNRVSGDLTVMPLIASSEYNDFIAISRGAKIAPEAGDPHGALAQAALAVNVKSERMKQWSSMASAFAPQARVEPFSWLGSSISLYLDDDPFWKELNEVPADKLDDFQRQAWSRVPLALQAEVSSSLKLAAFLAGVRAFIEQTAPGMTTWESLEYNGQPYVRVTPTEQGRRDLPGDANIALYYAPSPDGLTVTLNEAVLKRALDRRGVKRPASQQSSDNTAGQTTKETANATPRLPWLGDNLCFQVDQKMFELLNSPAFRLLGGPDQFSEKAMQLRSWTNLPILNEWKRLFPNEDPVKVHERLWHVTLICPGGGKYVWNDDWHTMESTVYGHPGEPKPGPNSPPILGQFQSANFGLTFEEQGLRAKLELTREKAKQVSKNTGPASRPSRYMRSE